jgi:hypothetical protein
MCHKCEKREIHTYLGAGHLKKTDHLEDSDMDSNILKGIKNKIGGYGLHSSG